MMNYCYGFQELLVTWAPNEEGAVSDDTCEQPMLATSWEYDLPSNFDDPDNQGSVIINLRQNVDMYVADGRHSVLTAEDVAWSFNDTGSDNPNADRTNTGALGAGCDAVGFDYTDTDKFSYETDSMVKAKAFREALIFAIDRDLIAETIVSGFGGPVYGTGHGAGVAFHQLHPEYSDEWAIPFDPGLAQQRLADSGVEDGFEFEYYCPAGNGTSIEVCQAVVGMWEQHLGLNPKIDNTAYSSRRPTMVGREINVVWQTSWGPNSNQGKLDAGGTIPVCCLWPIGSGGYNPGLEDNQFWNDLDTTCIQDKGSAENLATRKAIMDRWWDLRLGGGIVEVPTLIGMNPETVQEWDLKPWRLTNSFDTVKYKNP